MAKNAQVHLRIDSDKLQWFKAYCQRNGLTMSDVVRNWIDELRGKDERTQSRVLKAGRK